MLARRGARGMVLAICLVLGWAALVPRVGLARPAPDAPARPPGNDDGDSVARVAGHQYQITVTDGWTAASPGGPPLLAGYRHEDSGGRVVITRADYPNRGAWRQRAAFFEQVEDGLQASTPGYARLHRRQVRLDRVPAMDLVFRRRAGDQTEVVHMRFLFFRRYTLTLALVAPARVHRRHRRAYRKLVESFVPYLGA